MSWTAALTTFVTVLPAELPDKTILACLILSSRYRASYVFIGAAAAFAVQVALSVAVGGALSLLPHRRSPAHRGMLADRQRLAGPGGRLDTDFAD